jgi:hypothetical protein
MKSARMILLVAVALLIVASSASAAPTTTTYTTSGETVTLSGASTDTSREMYVSLVQVTDVGTPTGYTTWDIQVTTVNQVWVNGHLDGTVTAGSIWNATSKNKSVSQSALFDAYPYLKYDSWVTTHATKDADGEALDGNDRLTTPDAYTGTLTNSAINIDWGTNSTAKYDGAFTIARITVADGTDLVLNGKVWDGVGGAYYAGNYETFTVTFGSVPEPMTMALLAVGGISMLVRRRRNA